MIKTKEQKLNALTQSIITMLNDKEFKGKGAEVYYGYLSLSELGRDTCRVRLLNIITENIKLTFKGLHAEEKWKWRKNGNGKREHMDTTALDESMSLRVAEVARRDIEEMAKDVSPTRTAAVNQFALGRDIETVTRNIRDTHNLNDQFVVTLRWNQTDVHTFSMTVVSVGEFVANALVGRMNFREYLMVDDGAEVYRLPFQAR